jgi:hypothetical protein
MIYWLHDMIWLVKIPLVILIGAWAIWLWSTPSSQVIALRRYGGKS